jgi:hypothetical protein
MLGLPGVEFDAPKFEFLGVPAQDNFMIGVAKSTGITSVEQWKASGTLIKIGGVAPGGGTDDIPKVLKATLGLPLQLVSGYKGTGPVRLAFNAGEVQGACNSWESFKSTWRAEIGRSFLSPNQQRQAEHKSTDEADGISFHIGGLIGELMPFCQHKRGQHLKREELRSVCFDVFDDAMK